MHVFCQRQSRGYKTQNLSRRPNEPSLGGLDGTGLSSHPHAQQDTKATNHCRKKHFNTYPMPLHIISHRFRPDVQHHMLCYGMGLSGNTESGNRAPISTRPLAVQHGCPCVTTQGGQVAYEQGMKLLVTTAEGGKLPGSPSTMQGASPFSEQSSPASVMAPMQHTAPSAPSTPSTLVLQPGPPQVPHEGCCRHERHERSAEPRPS